MLAQVAAIGAAVFYATRYVWGDLHHRVIGVTETHWVEGVMWWYWNITSAAFYGHYPLDNNLHGYPVGYDHIALVGNFADAAMSAPFFWLFQPPAAYNLTITAFLLFNGLAAWWALRRWGGGPVIATLFGIVNTFHPLFHFFLDEGRPTQLLFGWVYLAIGATRALIDDPHHGRRWPLVLGLTGSFVCFWFNGFFLYLLLPMVAFAHARGLEPADRRALIGRGLTAFLWAMVCAFPFGLPVLYDVLWGEGIKGVALFTMPNPLEDFLFAARPWEVLLPDSRYSMHFPYSLSGVALVALVSWRRWRGALPGRAGWVLGALLFWVLTLGPYLILDEAPVKVGGRLVSLPWAWINFAIPFYSRLSYPYLVFPFFLFSVLVVVSAAMQGLSKNRWRLVAPVVGVVVAAEVGMTSGYTATVEAFSIPAWYTTLRDDADVRAIIEYPFGAMEFRQVHQAVHHKPMINSRGPETDVFKMNAALGTLVEQTPALSWLYEYQMRGKSLSHYGERERAQLVALGYDRMVVSAQSVGRSDRLRRVGLTGVVADLTGVFGQPIHEDDDVVVFEITGATR